MAAGWPLAPLGINGFLMPCDLRSRVTCPPERPVRDSCPPRGTKWGQRAPGGSPSGTQQLGVALGVSLVISWDSSSWKDVLAEQGSPHRDRQGDPSADGLEKDEEGWRSRAANVPRLPGTDASADGAAPGEDPAWRPAFCPVPSATHSCLPTCSQPGCSNDEAPARPLGSCLPPRGQNPSPWDGRGQ